MPVFKVSICVTQENTLRQTLPAAGCSSTHLDLPRTRWSTNAGVTRNSMLPTCMFQGAGVS